MGILSQAERTHFHNTMSRNIFPFSMEGCVLYVPLWQEDMQGSPVLSYDQYHHSCTVTGATWGSQGRTFDGTDDYISTTVDVTASTFTLAIWFRSPLTSSVDDLRALLEKRDVGDEWRLSITPSTAKVSFGAWNAAGLVTIGDFNSVITLSANTWYHGAITYDGSTARMYLNGVLDGSSNNSDGVIKDTASVIRIGTDSLDIDRYWDGLIGECAVHNRVLNAAEILQIYQVTKWRY